MATEIERLVVRMEANISKFDADMKKATRAANGAAAKISKDMGTVQAALDRVARSATTSVPLMGDALGELKDGFSAAALGAGLGTAAVSAFTFAVNKALEAMDFGDELQTQADFIGITAEAMQEYRFIADEVDVSQEKMNEGLRKLQENLGKAQQGGKGAAKVLDAFARVGFTQEQLKGFDTAAELLPVLSDRFVEMGGKAEDAGEAARLGIADLLPVLRLGSKGLQELTEKARELGLVLSNDTVRSLAAADRQMEVAKNRIDTSLRLAFTGLASDIAGASTQLANFLTTLTRLREEAPAAAQWIALFSRATGLVGLNPIGGFLADQLTPRPPGVAAPKPPAIKPPASPSFRPGSSAARGGGADKAAREAERAAERTARTAEEIARLKDDELEETYRLSRSIETRANVEAYLAENAGDRRVAEIEADAKKAKDKRQFDDAQRGQLIAMERRVTALKVANIEQARAADLRDQAADIDEQIAGYRQALMRIAESQATTEAERARIAKTLLAAAQAEERTALERQIIDEGINAAKAEQLRAELGSKQAGETKAGEFKGAGVDEARRDAGGIADEIAKADNIEERYAAMYAEIDRQRGLDVLNEEQAARAKAQIHARYTEERLANASTFFGTLAQLANSENKKLAAIGKAAAIAQATIDGFVAVQKALASAPPPWNFALAAAVGVVAAANVARIAGVPGFERGGWTGGVRGQPRGTVHGEEFVVRAGPAARHRSMLEAMNAGAMDVAPMRGAPVSPHLHMSVDLKGARGDKELLRLMDATARQAGAAAYSQAMRDTPGRIARHRKLGT